RLQASGNPSDLGPNFGEIDAEVLNGLVGLSLPGIGIPLIGDGENTGLLDLGPQAGVGATNAFTSSATPSTSIAAVGAVTDEGAVDVAPEFDPSDVNNAQLDLTALLGQLEVDGLTDEIVDELTIALGAVAARAEATGPGAYDSDYLLAGAELRVSSPAVGGLASTLDTTYDTVVGGLETTVNSAVGEGGTIDTALGLLEIPALNVLGLVTLELDDISAAVDVTIPDLSDALLTQAVSDDGLVTIDLTDGTIAVDVAQLVKGEDGEDLNGLAPNTSVLTDETIEAITAGVASALGNVVDSLNTQIVTGLQNSTLTITLNGEATAVGGVLTAPVSLTVAGTLAGFAGLADAPTPVVSSTTAIEIPLLGISIPAGAVVTAVASTLLPAVLAGVGPVVGSLLVTQSALVESTLTGVVDLVLEPLEPVLDGVLRQIVTLTINEQPTVAPINGTGDLGAGSFTVRALAIDVLPILGAGAVGVDLASASVRAAVLAPVVIATPDPVEIGAELTATGTGFTPLTELTVTYVDAGGNTVGTSTVTTDETGGFTDTITVPEETVLGILTVTADDGTLSGSDTTTVIDEGTGTDPTGTDPTGTDPTGTDPTGTDPTGTDPTGTDPTGTDPTGTDPTGTDPTGTDPTGTDPTGTDPTGTDPTGTDPTGTDPTGTDPTGTDPTGTDPTGTDPTGTDPTGTDPTGTDPTGTDPTGTDPTGTDPTGTDPTGTDPTGTDPTGTDPTGTDPTGTDPTGTDPTGTDPTGTDPTGTDPGAYDPTLVVDPGTVEPGEELTTNGSGYPPNTEVVVTYVDSEGNTIATSTVTTDDNGDFTDTITVPVGTPAGALVVTGTADGYAASDTAIVVTDELGIAIEQPTRYRGQVQVGHGWGYAPGTVVHGYMNSTPQIDLGTQVANADGEVTFTWTIPASAAIDTHTFSLTANGYDDQSVTFRVLANAAAPGPQLPSTGADTGLAMSAAILVLLGGAFALLSTRVKRRRGMLEG
ncbi:choice-of-anchor G family protein, partial [Pseudactinotalea suaedae]